MISKGEGFPCWNPPRPPNRPPKEIVPGDVGTVDAKESFRKLYNIWEDEDTIREFLHDEDFQVPFQELVERDDHHFVEGYALYSGAESTVVPIAGAGWSFTFTARNAEGACLALTDPASVDSLTEGCSQAVGDFIKQNADGLYSFARARGLQSYTKSPLYFVTSCTKTRSWGMASFINAERECPMKLEPVPSPSNPDQTAFRWTETKQFGKFCTSRPGGVPGVQDQPLFLDGWKLATSEQYRSEWRKSKVAGKVSRRDRDGDNSGSGSLGGSSHQGGYGPQFGGPSSSSNPSGSSHDYGGQAGGQGRSYDSGGTSNLGQDAGEGPLSQQELVRSLLETLKTNHPSDFLNKLMLLEFEASYALTHDNDWKFTLKGLRWDKNGFMTLMNALQREYPFEYRNGIAFFKDSWAPSEAASAGQRVIDGVDVPGSPALPPIDDTDDDDALMDDQDEGSGKTAPATHFPYVYGSQHLQASSSTMQEAMLVDTDAPRPLYHPRSDATPPGVTPPTTAETALVDQILVALDCEKEGVLTAGAVRGRFSSNVLPEGELTTILGLSDPEHSGILTKTELVMSLRMVPGT
ncbi:hypothetical protein H1R20_g11707, partial [Candolleomyces eurysporus]